MHQTGASVSLNQTKIELLPADVGPRVRVLRERCPNLDLRRMGKASGIHYTTLSLWENGKRRLPRDTQALIFAIVCDELLRERERIEAAIRAAGFCDRTPALRGEAHAVDEWRGSPKGRRHGP